MVRRGHGGDYTVHFKAALEALQCFAMAREPFAIRRVVAYQGSLLHQHRINLHASLPADLKRTADSSIPFRAQRFLPQIAWAAPDSAQQPQTPLQNPS